MKKLHYYSMVALLAASSIAMPGCTKDEYSTDGVTDNMEIKTSIAFPIAHGHFQFKEIFDSESVKGIIIDTKDKEYVLSEYSDGSEFIKLLPLDVKAVKNFSSTYVIDGLDLSEVFGPDNAITDIEELILTLDTESDMPFDVTFGMYFTDDPEPKTSSEPNNIKQFNDMVKATGKMNKNTFTVKYADIVKELQNSTAIVLPMSFAMPASVSDVTINTEQQIDIMLKMYVKGTINPNNL